MQVMNVSILAAKPAKPERTKLNALYCGLLSAAALSVAMPAAAAPAAGDVDQVVVTAQKREESVSNVPISITVLGGARLDSSAVNLSEQLNRIPGVAAMPESTATTLLTVRGVSAGSGFINGASPIAYYIDGMPFGLTRSALAPNLNAYDLERVEVLRGPQGTLYGANAQNGVVRVITKDPDLDTVEFKMRAAAASTKDGEGAYRGDAAFNLPIISDKLAARLVVGYEKWGGWIDHPNQKDVNDETVKNIRLKVRAKPTERLTIGLSTWYWQDEFKAPNVGAENRTHPALIEEPQKFRYNTWSGTISYDFDKFYVSNVTSYLSYKSLRKNDRFTTNALVDTILDNGLNSKVFSNELNLGSVGDGPWRWTAGGIYRRGKDHFYQWRKQYANPLGNRFSDQSTSYALFGELTRGFWNNRLELTGGLRYFEDHVVSQEIARLGNLPAGQSLIRSTGKFDAVSPRLVATWHATDQILTYASWSKGFRSGFPQAPYLNLPTFPPVDADNLTNYEAGTKATFWDGRGSLEAAVFYIDWTNIQQQIQVQLLVAGTPTNFLATVNGAKASGPGAEIGLSLRPVRAFNISGNFSWNNLTVDDRVLSGTTVIFAEGDRLVNSPKYTAGAAADYTFDLGTSGLQGKITGGVNYISKRQVRGLLAGQNVVETGDNMTTLRASFDLISPKGWDLTLYGENLNDEKGSPIADLNPIPNLRSRIRPRTFGVMLSYQFK